MLAKTLLGVCAVAALSLHGSSAQRNYSSSYVQSNYRNTDRSYHKKCGFPNAIPPWESHKPEDVHGLWYIYRQYLSSDDTNTLNNIFGVYGLNATAVPLTNIFAENQWLPSSYYSSTDGGNTYTCQYDHWIGSVGRDGSQIGIDYNSETNPAYAPNPQSTMAIKYDYRKYSIDYGCSSPNLKTGICASPIVYVSTRVRPTQLSYHEKMETDRVVDAVFAPYCRSADDIPLQQYDDNKPDCSLPLQPQDCANSTLQVMGIDTDIFVGLTRVEIPTAFGRF
ncbi:uncharacterized protein LOC129600057 isoform X1 [Paramacrobiotus metropolitanus]|uniref:uncharacterized protein LOC129600057 isoform X1 n=1 Tax=Paramacrobiotus metropolitanus TaxID=2943436 RepID=UPI002445CD1D|nr:uncharacterized protein LOC129600057 isoform X1 [Paramacrobiotus metropolitanus]